MKLTKFKAAIAIGSIMAAGSALAQAPKGDAETKAPSSQSTAPKSSGAQQGSPQRSGQAAQPSQQGQNSATAKGKSGEGASSSEAKRQTGSESGQTKSNRAERDPNAAARSQAKSKSDEKSKQKSKQAETKRNGEQNKPEGKSASKEGSRDGRATGTDRKTKSNGKAQQSPDSKTATDANKQNQQGNSSRTTERNRDGQNANRQGNTERVQLSVEQRTQAKQTILRNSNVNRARNATFNVNIGVRVPRSVRLAPIPAAVISIVPQYRSYRYVVVDDRICIVDPGSYTVVEVLDEGSAVPSSRGTQEARLVLTPEEEEFVLQSVDMGGSTLGLGAITIGSPVPRNERIMEFAPPVIERVAKLRSYEYIAADNRVAIVEPQSRNVVYIIERRR